MVRESVLQTNEQMKDVKLSGNLFTDKNTGKKYTVSRYFELTDKNDETHGYTELKDEKGKTKILNSEELFNRERFQEQTIRNKEAEQKVKQDIETKIDKTYEDEIEKVVPGTKEKINVTSLLHQLKGEEEKKIEKPIQSKEAKDRKQEKVELSPEKKEPVQVEKKKPEKQAKIKESKPKGIKEVKEQKKVAPVPPADDSLADKEGKKEKIAEIEKKKSKLDVQSDNYGVENAKLDIEIAKLRKENAPVKSDIESGIKTKSEWDKYITETEDYIKRKTKPIKTKSEEKPQKQVKTSGKKTETKTEEEAIQQEETIQKSKNEAARETGTAEINGKKITRQEPIKNIITGKETVVHYAKKDSEKANYVLIEKSDLQPSHINGIENEKHFLKEAQPRDRGKTVELKNAANEKAKNLDVSKMGMSPDAYSGPTNINERGEVIQGSGRGEAMHEYYRIDKEDSKGYKKFLKENAESFGFKPEDIDKFKEPVLARMHKVSDERAIKLGNYTNADLEDIADKMTKVKATINQISPEKLSEIADMLSSRVSEDNTLKDIIRDMNDKIIRKFQELEILRKDATELYLDEKGNIKGEGVDEVYNIIKGLLFKDGDTQLPRLYEKLPYATKQALDKSIIHILALPKDKTILPEIQDAIMGVYEFRNSGADFDTWLNQTDAFNPGARERYNGFELELIDLLSSVKKQNELVPIFAEFRKNVIGTPADLFEPEIKGLSKTEAIKKQFKEYKYGLTESESEKVSEGSIGKTEEKQTTNKSKSETQVTKTGNQEGERLLREEKPMFQRPEFAGLTEADLKDPKVIEDARKEWLEKETESKYFKKWFKDSKVVDENGNPLVVYSGHSNTEMYGNYNPKKSRAGGFYASEDPEISSNYSLGKSNNNYYENGEQYRLEGKGGKLNKKLRQYELNEKQLKKLEELKKRKNEYGDYDFGITEMDRYIEENKSYDKNVKRWYYNGGSKNLQNIYEFNENMGYNIAYDKEGTEPLYLRQQKNETELILDELGIKWNSFDRLQPGVYPIYLNIKNPLDAEKPFPLDLLKALKEKAKYEKNKEWASDMQWTSGYPLKEWVKDIEKGDEYWTTQIPIKAKEILKQFGYDGIKERGAKGTDSPREERQINWIVFEPEQIKSATGNIGTFDAKNPDIRFQKPDVFKDENMIEGVIGDPVQYLKDLKAYQNKLNTNLGDYKKSDKLNKLFQEVEEKEINSLEDVELRQIFKGLKENPYSSDLLEHLKRVSTDYYDKYFSIKKEKDTIEENLDKTKQRIDNVLSRMENSKDKRQRELYKQQKENLFGKDFEERNEEEQFAEGEFPEEKVRKPKSVDESQMTMFQRPVFFSGLERIATDKLPNTATTEQIKNTLLNNGVKQAEYDWLGIDEFLQGKEKVSKQELLDFIRSNKVEVEEVMKGDNSFYKFMGKEDV
ncbi:MAG: hypothetical protein WC358_11070, partial [Ignavibacteria bacterium]